MSESEEKWQHLRKRFGIFGGNLSAGGRPADLMIDRSRITELDYLKNVEAQAIAEQEQSDLENKMLWERGIRHEVMLTGGYSSTPTPNLNDHEKRAAEIDVAQLRVSARDFQEEHEVNLDLQNIINVAVFSPAVLKEVDEWRFPASITYSQGGSSRGRLIYKEGYEEEVAFAKEAIALLKENDAFYCKVKAIYEAALQKKLSETPAQVKQKLGEIQQICDAGRKLKRIILKVAAAWRNGKCNGKEACKFVEARERLRVLEAEYNVAYKILTALEAREIPNFATLTFEDIHDRIDIEAAAKSEKSSDQ
jgi:hypothetical protein